MPALLLVLTVVSATVQNFFTKIFSNKTEKGVFLFSAMSTLVALVIFFISFGEVALLGISGEPFTDIGRRLKETEGYKMVLPTALTNGFDGYFPTRDTYEEGGYEARSSNFKAGVGELIIEEGKALLKELRK